MPVSDVYTIVNSVVGQALGTTALTATNSYQLVDMGNAVISSSANTESFMNVLADRIGRTIFTDRAYSAKFQTMILTDMEMGGILQKISVDIFDAETDSTGTDGAWGLTQGQSVDQWKVNKPDTKQSLFAKRSVYKYHVSVAREQIKSAFTSESAMGQFINYVFQAMQNSIEFGIEQLGRLTMANYIAQVNNSAQASKRVIPLVSNFNTAFDPTTDLTAETALRDPDFLRYATEQINLYSDYLTDMSKAYNDGTIARHTPKSEQRLYVLSSFEKRLETVVQYAAFHKEFVSLNGYETINYWQAQQTPANINVNIAASTPETVNNVMAVLTDRYALGLAKMDDFVLTTPVNASGAYYNVFHHIHRMWINDLSENGVIFTLG